MLFWMVNIYEDSFGLNTADCMCWSLTSIEHGSIPKNHPSRITKSGLSNFLRMLNVSIPHRCFDVLTSYALLLIDQERNLVDAGLND